MSLEPDETIPPTVVRYVLELSGDLSFRSGLTGKQTRPGFQSGGRKRHVREFETGTFPSADHGWVDKDSLIDREAKIRRERLVRKSDGQVLHEQDHPLKDHLGHGADKS
jgi:hypothetical protein